MERVSTTEQEPNGSRGLYYLAAFLAPVIWGFMAVPVRLVKAWSAEDILYYRILVASAVLWTIILLFRRNSLKKDYRHLMSLPKPSRKKTIFLILLASVLIFGNWYSYIYCINHISVQAGAFAYVLCPLITTATGFFVLKEQLSPIKKVSLLVALGSVLLLTTGSLTEVLWSLGIGSLYAFYLVLQRVIQGFDKLNGLAIQMAICTLIILPSLWNNSNPVPDSSTFWAVISTIAIGFTIIPLFFSMYALKKISSSTLGVMLYVNPIIAFVLAITYFGETIDSQKYWAYGLLIMAVLLFNSEVLSRLFGLPQRKM